MSFNGKFPPGLFPGDLAGHWRFHPSQNLADSTKNGNTLTNTGSTVIGTELIHDGYYSTFDGSNAHVFTGSNSSSIANLPQVTVEGWVNPTGPNAVDSGCVFTKGDNISVGFVFSFNGQDKLFFRKFFASTTLDVTSNTGLISYATWQHWACTWDGTLSASGTHIYINGLEATYSATQNGVGANSTDAGSGFKIGNGFINGHEFFGKIGPLKVWNKAMTPQQIGWIYNKWK